VEAEQLKGTEAGPDQGERIVVSDNEWDGSQQGFADMKPGIIYIED
jgi:hypothetical protein